MNSFAKRFKHLRNKNKITQEIMGEILDVDRTYICKLEKGLFYPSRDKMIQIKNFFGDLELVSCYFDEIINDNLTEKG